MQFFFTLLAYLISIFYCQMSQAVDWIKLFFHQFSNDQQVTENVRSIWSVNAALA